jgi:hypothetical protein
VLLPLATELEMIDTSFRAVLTKACIDAVVALIPAEWLIENTFDVTAEAMRNIYAQFLMTRINSSAIFIKEAQDARAALI